LQGPCIGVSKTACFKPRKTPSKKCTQHISKTVVFTPPVWRNKANSSQTRRKELIPPSWKDIRASTIILTGSDDERVGVTKD
jgi:hypothetical protein